MSVIILDKLVKDFDISDLNRFGEIKTVPRYNASPFQLDRFEEDLLFKLRTFDPNKDFIALVGRTLYVTVALLLLFKHFDSLKILLYDAVDQRYVERKFNNAVSVTLQGNKETT